jgi:hypothetical protein
VAECGRPVDRVSMSASPSTPTAPSSPNERASNLNCAAVGEVLGSKLDADESDIHNRTRGESAGVLGTASISGSTCGGADATSAGRSPEPA